MKKWSKSYIHFVYNICVLLSSRCYIKLFYSSRETTVSILCILVFHSGMISHLLFWGKDQKKGKIQNKKGLIQTCLSLSWNVSFVSRKCICDVIYREISLRCWYFGNLKWKIWEFEKFENLGKIRKILKIFWKIFWKNYAIM